MILILYAFIFTCTLKLTQTSSLKEMFNINADQMFESEIGNIDQLRIQLQRRSRPKVTIKTLDQQEVDQFNAALKDQMTTFKPPPKTTTERVQLTQHTVHPILNNFSYKELEIRRKKFHLIRLLELERNGIPDFEKGDDPDTITRRFDRMSTRPGDFPPRPALREVYFDGYDIPRIQGEKYRLLQLMAHFIYVSRYKLPFMQRMRLKYKKDIKYQIGFCFALLRQLRREQKLIWQTTSMSFTHYNHITIFVKFYERVLKLNQDIRDLVRFIFKLNYDMHKKYDPQYYIDSDEQTVMPDFTFLQNG